MPWDPFAALSDAQREQLKTYEKLLLRYNQKINLVSRASTEAFHVEHLLHCLALTRRGFPAGTQVVDWGTGGGLPAVPLAICFPEVSFYAVDAVEKKVQVVRTIARRLRLENLFAWHGRAEKWPGRAQRSVSRATAPLEDLWRWHARVATLEEGTPEDAWAPGLLCLKGGDLSEEEADLHDAFSGLHVETIPLQPLLGRVDFAEKYIVVVTATGDE